MEEIRQSIEELRASENVLGNAVTEIKKRIGDKPRLNYCELENITVTEYNH